MRKQITQYVRECGVCQQQKASHLQPVGLLQPLPIPSQVWENLTMDFIEALPKSGGFDTILVVVDCLTKYAHFIGLKHPFSAPTVAVAFIQHIVRLHDFLASIILDRDKFFMSLFWKELFRLQGMTLRRSTTYHPQIDGQSEVVSRTLETYFRSFIHGKPKEWSQWLYSPESCYNIASHSAINMSPFQALYGRPPPSLVRFESHTASMDSLESLLWLLDAVLDELKFHLIRAQHRMKVRVDGHSRELHFDIGDMMFLKL